MFRTLRIPAHLICLALIVIGLTGGAFGQTKKPPFAAPKGGFGNDFGFGDDLNDEQVTASGYFTPPDANGRATLFITAEIAPGWHIYSITQKPGGPNKSKLKVTEQGFRLLGGGTFSPNANPQVHRDEKAFPGVDLEEHSGSVTWQAPIQFDRGVDPSKVEINGAVHAQACKESCLFPKDYAFTAKLFAASGNLPGNDASHVAITGRIEPQEAAPGDTIKLILTAVPQQNWHIYAQSNRVPDIGAKPTIIPLTNTSGWRASAPVADSQPVEGKGADGEVLHYYDKPVSWTIELQVPKDAKPGDFSVAGMLGYQVCSEQECDKPQAARFEAFVPVRAASKSGAIPLRFTPLKSYDLARGLLPPAPGSVWQFLLLAFLGGIILNLMPCVLPVIGLKLFSFIEQSGHDRKRIFTLNLWYTAGLLSVFMALATMAVAANLGLGKENLAWGEQFSSTTFSVAMACVVFAFALSFLGVWEIPIPGFVGSGKATELAAKEGAAGAFAKGVLSTVLATPCSGPLLGPVFGFTIAQPTLVIYALFAAIGLGMASPYLLIGAFPWLIKLLPKPGAWMDTFKQGMGFVLLGTVVYIFTFLNKDYLVPTFALLMGLWLGCWWIGRTPLTAELGEKMTGWVTGAALAGAVGWFSFAFLTPQKQLIPWQPFSPALLTQLKQDGKTVMIDFTADWCPTCKWNLKTSINRQDVLDAIQTNGVVPLLADWTTGSPEIKEALTSLNSRSIPVLAIFPADKPNEPIILRDLISKQQILDALKEAGPSKQETKPAELATRNKVSSWKSFSKASLNDLQRERRNVLVDFSAAWSTYAKLQDRILEDPVVVETMQSANVVPLFADCTEQDFDAEPYTTLRSHSDAYIPSLVIYPASHPLEPIVLRGSASKQEIIDALKQVGKTKNVGSATTAALSATGKRMEQKIQRSQRSLRL